MKKYMHPECEMITVASNDVITTSGVGVILGWDDGQEIEVE